MQAVVGVCLWEGDRDPQESRTVLFAAASRRLRGVCSERAGQMEDEVVRLGSHSGALS